MPISTLFGSVADVALAKRSRRRELDVERSERRARWEAQLHREFYRFERDAEELNFYDASGVRAFHNRLDEFEQALMELESDAPVEVLLSVLDELTEVIEFIKRKYPPNDVQIGAYETREMRRLRQKSERRHAREATSTLSKLRKVSVQIEASVDAELTR